MAYQLDASTAEKWLKEEYPKIRGKAREVCRRSWSEIGFPCRDDVWNTRADTLIVSNAGVSFRKHPERIRSYFRAPTTAYAAMLM